MRNEDRVRRAAEVALEYASKIPEGNFALGTTVFSHVFDAMVYDQTPATASEVEAQKETKP